MTRSSAIRVVIALVRSEWSICLPKGWVWDGLHPYLWIQDVTSESFFFLIPDVALVRVLETCFATMMLATPGRTFQERTCWAKMASDVHVFRNILTHVITTHVCIPMSQWKSECFSAACPLWLFQVSSRQPKLNLLQSLAKPSKAWTGCYELICCKAPWRSVLEETNCLAKHGRAWAGDVLSSKNHVPLLSCLWFPLSFFAVWWHLFLLYSDDIQAQIQVVDLATCESLAQMTEQLA